MRKALFICLLSLGLFFIWLSPVGAHVTGAFQDFLLALQDEESTEALNEALTETEGKYDSLKKKTEEQEQAYATEQEKMMDTLVFYDTVAVDLYASFLFNGEELVDVLANERILKRQTEADMAALESFYNQYRQWQQALASVKGYYELLHTIQTNQAYKTTLLETFPNVSASHHEAYAILLQTIWNKDMAYVDEHLIEDSKRLSASLPSLREEGFANDVYRLPATKMNEESTLTYLAQPDHIYVAYEKGDAHLILITQLTPHPDMPHAYYLEMEAGFLNGTSVSRPILESLNGLFVLDYGSLLAEEKEEWWIRSSANSLVLQPASSAKE